MFVVALTLQVLFIDVLGPRGPDVSLDSKSNNRQADNELVREGHFPHSRGDFLVNLKCPFANQYPSVAGPIGLDQDVQQ